MAAVANFIDPRKVLFRQLIPLMRQPLRRSVQLYLTMCYKFQNYFTL